MQPYSASGVAGSGFAGGAALVAAHVCPLALGVDALGEVRVPAALCGAVGFRPTPGRYSHGGVLSLSPSLETLALVGRTVADVQLADAVLAAGASAHPAAAAAAVAPLGSPRAGAGAGAEGAASTAAAAAPATAAAAGGSGAAAAAAAAATAAAAAEAASVETAAAKAARARSAADPE